MKGISESHTSPTLLGQLRHNPNDQAAWSEFVRRYGPKILKWCRKWGLQAMDAEDVAQDVLLKLAAKMRSFDYDPSGSFRGWLWTITRHAWFEFVKDREQNVKGSGDSQVLQLLNSVEAGDDLVKRLDEEFDRELLDRATALVQLRVEEKTWQAFYLTAIEGLSGTEVASRIGMETAMVYVAKSRVQKMLKEKIQDLESPKSGEGKKDL